MIMSSSSFDCSVDCIGAPEEVGMALDVPAGVNSTVFFTSSSTFVSAFTSCILTSFSTSFIPTSFSSTPLFVLTNALLLLALGLGAGGSNGKLVNGDVSGWGSWVYPP